jgi:hypothetical protein
MAPEDRMLDWWQAPLSGAATHAVAPDVAWHARLMVLAWGLMIPVGVLWARFWKVMPGQDWPRELDRPTWWNAHRGLQIGGVAIGAVAVTLVWSRVATTGAATLHHALGWAVLAAGGVQILHGFGRGTKGGPTAPTPRGDHFDMTRRRVVFERVHKSLGWIVVMAAVAAIISGLVVADAPRWMLAVLLLWWGGLVAALVHWQRSGRALDTYQAIWGTDPALPGNRRPPIGWGIARGSAAAAQVRRDGREKRGAR